MKTISNEEKAKELAFKSPQCQMYIDNKCNHNFPCCNFLKKWAQDWLIEQLTAFAVHLNKRGAFRDDLCMDFEHEAQSFIELQKPKKL